MPATPALPRAQPQDVGLDAGRLNTLSALLRERSQASHLPGAVMLVARHDKVAWLDAVGRLDPSRDSSMTEDAIFRIYSMTKPVVSVAAMSLLEQGRLLLTDPVGKYLPAFANPQVLVERGGDLRTEPANREITIQDLLRHTSGLTYEFLGDGPVHKSYIQARLNDPRRTAAEHCDNLAKIPLTSHPGTQFAYSRSTDVLARVLEVICAQPLSLILRERVFEPLQMHETGFHVEQADHPRIAEPFGHDPDTGDVIRLLEPRIKPALEMGGGGLMSTAMDYARFCQMLLNRGELDGRRIIGRKTLELMATDHLGSIPQSGSELAPGHGFGLGFAVRLGNGIAPFPGSAGQFSWSGIAGTHFWIDPSERMFAILLIQAPGQREHYRNLFRALVHAAIND